MDRKIEKKKWTTKKIAMIAGITVIVIFILYNLLFADTRSKVNAELDKITISTVSMGLFQEFIPVTGTVLPAKTIYLDAVQSGTISKIYKESGAMLTKGDLILELTNSNLQLSVMSQESQLFEQINLLRNTRLALDQNSLNQQAILAEIDYQLQLLKPQYQRYKQLYEKKLISKREFEEVKENYDYNLKRKQITYTSFKKDSISKEIQLIQVSQSERRMFESLDAVRHILDNLIIKAPIDGQLSTPELEIGQSIAVGERLGQVDILDKYKVRVEIDEHYLPRVKIGQTGTFEFSNDTFALKITKIYPTIAQGKFEVDMEFIGKVPEGIKRGQTFYIRLELGNSETTMLLPTGGFYKDSGGNWVFVLENSGKRASKREIKLGRKNPEFFEVLEGLEPGEKVITSSYEIFGDNEVVVLN